MDPLSAFSLACNILQAVEVGVTLLKKVKEYHANGSLAEQEELASNLRTLIELNTELEHGQYPPPQPSGTTSVEARLIAANNECLRVSRDFAEFLAEFRGGGLSVWRSVLKSLRSLASREKLATFQSSVAESRSNLNLAFLMLIQERITMVQTESIKVHSNVETRILGKVDESRSSMQEEIRLLSSRLGRSSMQPMEDAISDFRSTHQSKLDELSKQIDRILESQESLTGLKHADQTENQSVVAHNRILESLRFPEANIRRETIAQPHSNTYEWIFQQRGEACYGSHTFVSWLMSSDEASGIYWIRGKAGSGKSTIMRLIDSKLNYRAYLSPWTGRNSVIKASHFLWGPGNELQKSFLGLLRSLLHQILDSQPDLTELCISASKWRTALVNSSCRIEWSSPELLRAIFSAADLGRADMFLLIDGLDEVAGGNEQHEQVVNFIHDCTRNRPSIKFCISSRPDNIFRDAFEQQPQLLLEKFTYDDISQYVVERFSQQKRLHALMDQQPALGSLLVDEIMRKASGVFLWVRLVVQEVVFGAQDGDSLAEILDNVSGIPKDLDDYFRRFIASIEIRHRREASIFLQVALHQEDEFLTLHELGLMDVSYIHNGCPNFALRPGVKVCNKGLAGPDRLQQTLDSASRRLNSRCRGLLEHSDRSRAIYDRLNWDIDFEVVTESDEQIMKSLDIGVDFLHRSFRDFLLQPDVRRQIEDYTDGPYDVRLFLCNCRLAQLEGLDISTSVVQAQIALGLASYVLSAIGTPNLKASPEAKLIAERLTDIVESIRHFNVTSETYWYLIRAMEGWDQENSSFLTVAIEFDLVSYLKEHLTAAAICEKSGRPILDYILMRRLHHLELEQDLGMLSLNVELLREALRLGANPNHRWLGASTFARYLVHLRLYFEDCSRNASCIEEGACRIFRAITLLLEYNADPVLPAAWFRGDYTGGNGFPVTSAMETEMRSVADILRDLQQEHIFTDHKAEFEECIRLAEAKASSYINTFSQDDT